MILVVDLIDEIIDNGVLLGGIDGIGEINLQFPPVFEGDIGHLQDQGLEALELIVIEISVHPSGGCQCFAKRGVEGGGQIF